MDSKIFEDIRDIGAAIGRVNGNNTHSGNISLRDSKDKKVFYITAGGCQTGNIVYTDIIPLKFSDVTWGDAIASSESNIHRKILEIPESNCVIHSHFIYSTLISFDSKDKQIFNKYIGDDSNGREQFLFMPADITGANTYGSVVSAHYDQPVGSMEMQERLPIYLKDRQVTIIKGHGSFGRGKTLKEVLSLLSSLEMSAKFAVALRRKGVDTVGLAYKLKNLIPKLAVKQSFLKFTKPFISEINDAAVKSSFNRWLNFNYNFGICGYGTGSMSQKITAKKMLFCNMGGVPKNFDFPIVYESIDFSEDDSLDLMIHKLIYQNTSFTTCMITSSPLASAEAMHCLYEKYGQDSLFDEKTCIDKKDCPTIKPIDAEAIYLNPRVGALDIVSLIDRSPQNPLLNMLGMYKGCCAAAGYGVISCGEATLEQAAHNASSAERIAIFRSNVLMNEKIIDGPSLKLFEPKQ